jgi:hypothetical protein
VPHQQRRAALYGTVGYGRGLEGRADVSSSVGVSEGC